MPRPCSICSHPDVGKINSELLGGQPYRNVAERYRISPPAIVRHKPHIAKALVKAKAKEAAKEDVQAETVLDRLMSYHRTIQELLTEARQSKDHVGALRAVQAGLKQLELEARLLGDLKDHSGSGTGVTVQVVYVSANSGAASR